MIHVISIGGSLIVPDKLNTRFIKEFKRVILKAAAGGDKFLIIPGGGQTCRSYQDAARSISNPTNEDLDWIGIKTNHLHSYFLRAVFGKDASPEVIGLDGRVGQLKKAISICVGGLEPGGTSDSTAVKFAEKFRARTIVNLTNVAGVYDKDPRKFRNARLIREMSWADLRKQFGSVKTPGRHMPFDSLTASTAARLRLKVVTMDGRNLKNFQNFLAGKSFKGTVIQ
ncbi:MAG: hypothetical protein A2751_04360 [Candidatus Doudnabacteria bacterium RIFCSPHIGHO2_01_FULL_46_14]|uniref:Aspartate/glutamate/uridylate kinase domain-containing protein n=1 Tax=Candidatus Doudnabacteria bacterium RIFCSPHIGHO2_01_FULL_46_14 TaxID=1817824 RepID=A0A1F5NNI7_9BACT|nr:MAG: hypothetical protein A2751_04360 [Candidatus Doudnabacteria bacterium RIFCSPHIGHO2_01_FULL_46_14]